VVDIKFMELGITMDFREPATAFLLTRKKIDSIYLLCFKRKPIKIILFIFLKNKQKFERR